LLTYLGVVYEIPVLFLFGAFVNVIAECANLILIWGANNDKVVDGAEPKYGYMGHTFNIFLSIIGMAFGTTRGAPIEDAYDLPSEDV